LMPAQEFKGLARENDYSFDKVLGYYSKYNVCRMQTRQRGVELGVWG